MAIDQKSLTKVKEKELLDLLGNMGILQEVNRTFLNPIGLNLILNKELDLELHQTDEPEGIILHTVDTFQLKSFNDFRNIKHKTRQEKLGFVIQTTDLIRKDNLAKERKIHLSSPQNLKLNKLLNCVDFACFEVKRRFMEKSQVKDKDGAEIDFKQVYTCLREDTAKKNYIDVIARAVIMLFKEDLTKEMEKIDQIKKEQKRVFKKGE